MEGDISRRIWKSFFKEARKDKREQLIVKGTIVLILLIVFCLTLVESGIILAVRNVIVLSTLIWIVSKVEKLKNRR